MDIIFQPTRDKLGEFAPVPAKKIIPQWYKDLPFELHGVNAQDMVDKRSKTPFSIKRCVPVLDFLTSGYVIRSESEILISNNDANNMSVSWFTPTKDSVSFHPHDQCPIHINGSRKSYFKLATGYRVITPPGYSCLFYQSPYFFESRFTLFPAIVDTDKYDAEVLFPGYVNGPKENVHIDAGTPLLWVFPFKRTDWQSKTMSKEYDFDKSSFSKKSANYILNIYKRFFHTPKTYE